MPSETRDRILETTAELVRRQGLVGTGLKQIAAEAGAPFGSIYHFFPGGKEELAAEVIRSSGRRYQDVVAAALLSTPDPVVGTGEVFRRAAEDLVESDYADACPIATVALEVASTNEVLRDATADVFTAWLDAGTEYFAGHGVERGRARELVTQLVMELEGAFLLCRALRDTEPLEVAGRTMQAAVAGALEAAG